MLGKFKAAVLGNPVTREYEIGRHVASGGPSCLWKIYDGVKKTSRHPVSIFVYDKKAAEIAKVPKKEREQIVAMLKKGPTQLIKLRHPKLLTVEHTVEESRDCLAFATEPVSCSLANLLGNYENLPSPLPLAIKEYDLHPVELKYGLLQVAEGLVFLHNEVKMLHGNLTPESVLITKQGGWKLAAFNYCCFTNYQSDAQTVFEFHEWNSREPFRTQRSLNYLAPEYILSQSCEAVSDLFSYGVLVHAVYNRGQPLFESENNLLTYKQRIEHISRAMPSSISSIPSEGQELVRLLLNVTPSVRPDAMQVTKAPLFDDAALVTLQYLDTLMQKDDMQKSQFFKALHKILPKMPKRVVYQRILPALSWELRNYPMIPFILPNVLLIAEDSTMDEYARLVLPVLIPVFKVQEPIQVLLIFLQKMDLLLTRTPPDAVKSEVLPMIFRALDSQVPQIQELCVSILPSFANMIDYTSMKHAIVPKLRNLCLITTSLKVRINVLVCIGKMLDVLDKWLIQDHVLPLLEGIPSHEPGVLMATLGILKEVLNRKKLGFDKVILSQRVLPFLLPLAIEPGLNENQFRTFMTIIRDMIQKVETDHAAYLQQLGQMQQETRSSVKFAQEVSEAKAMDDMLDKMEKLMGKDEKAVAGESPSVLQPSPAVPASTMPSPLDSAKAEEMDKLFAGLDAFGSTVSSAGISQQNTIPVLSKPPDSPSPAVPSKHDMSTGWSIMTSITTSTVGTSSPPILTRGSVFENQTGLQSSSMAAGPLQPTTVSTAPMDNTTPTGISTLGSLLPQTAVTAQQTPVTSSNTKPLQPMQLKVSAAVNLSGRGGLLSGLQPAKPQSSLVSTAPAATSVFSAMSGGGLLQPTPSGSTVFGQSQRSQQEMSSKFGAFGQGLSGGGGSGGLLEPMKPPQSNTHSSMSMTSSLSQPSPGVTHIQPVSTKSSSFGQFEEARPQSFVPPSRGQAPIFSTPLEPMKAHTTMPSTVSMTAQPLTGGRAPSQPISSTPIPLAPHPSSLKTTHQVQAVSSAYPVLSTTQGQSSMFSQPASMSWPQHQNVKTQSSPQMPNFTSSMGMPVTSSLGQQPVSAIPVRSQLSQGSTMGQNVSGLAGIQPQPTQNFRSSQPGFSKTSGGRFSQPMGGLLQPTWPEQPLSTPLNQWSTGSSGTTLGSQGMGTINWNQSQTNQMVGVNPMGANQGQPMVPQPSTQPFGFQPQGILQPMPSMLNPGTSQSQMSVPIQPAPGANPFG